MIKWKDKSNEDYSRTPTSGIDSYAACDTVMEKAPERETREEAEPPTSRAITARSGLAVAAGFAALAFIFRDPFTAFVFQQLKWMSVLSVFILDLCGLSAPVALILAIAAWVELKRHPEKTGKIPAAVGLIIGVHGSLVVTNDFISLISYLFKH